MPSYSVPLGNALLTTDGGVGIFFVATPFDFKVGATVRLVSDTVGPTDLRVAGVHPETGAVTVLSAVGGFKPDLTAYLVTDNARAIQDSQLIGSDIVYVELAGQSASLYADVLPRDPDPEVYLPVRLTNGASFYNATGGGSGGGTVDQGQAGTDPWAVAGEVSQGAAGADPWPVSGPLTDDELRANPVDVSGIVMVSNFPVTQPVSGPLTDVQLRATPVPVQVEQAGTGFELLYNEITSVGAGVESVVITVAAPPGGYRVGRIETSGDNLSEYRVKVDGVTQMFKRSSWTEFNASFEFGGANGGLVLTSGQVLTLTALHNSADLGTYEATVMVN